MTKRINSRAKGAAGERELANYLTDAGWPAHRGQQFAGGTDSPDVVCGDLTRITGAHIEVKRVEALDLFKAYEQAVRDAGPGRRPMVFHRRNPKKPGQPARPWLVILSLDDFLELAGRLPDERLNGKAEGT